MQMFYYLIQFVTLNLIVIPLTGNLLCLTLIQIFVEATYLKNLIILKILYQSISNILR